MQVYDLVDAGEGHLLRVLRMSLSRHKKREIKNSGKNDNVEKLFFLLPGRLKSKQNSALWCFQVHSETRSEEREGCIATKNPNPTNAIYSPKIRQNSAKTNSKPIPFNKAPISLPVKAHKWSCPQLATYPSAKSAKTKGNRGACNYKSNTETPKIISEKLNVGCLKDKAKNLRALRDPDGAATSAETALQGVAGTRALATTPFPTKQLTTTGGWK